MFHVNIIMDMYVRQMRKGDEAWLLSKFEEMELDDPAFRSRDYVLAIDADGDTCGFGRVYRYTDGAPHVRLANIETFGSCDADHTRARIFEALFEKAFEYECEVAYIVADDEPAVPFEFEECNPEAVDVAFDVEERLFVADVYAVLGEETEEEKLQSLADEFGYENATTKYSID
jgi:hypothetical protein